uniref:Uncharacterized protein n=1 Tax=Sus scrofa TaxID=9823 RepID=A0A480FVQ3_PIG
MSAWSCLPGDQAAPGHIRGMKDPGLPFIARGRGFAALPSHPQGRTQTWSGGCRSPRNLEGVPIPRLGGWGQKGERGGGGRPTQLQEPGVQGQGQERSGLGAPAMVSTGAAGGPWGQSPGSGRRAAGSPPGPGPESSGLGHSPESAPGPAGEAEAQGPESGGGACVGGQGLSLGAQGAAGVESGRSGQRCTGRKESSPKRCFIAVRGLRAPAEQGTDSLGVWHLQRVTVPPQG